jgi:hypothetical protein
MSAFREFVTENYRWFSGRLPETEESFAIAEQQLGVRFPDDLRWLLITYGYSYATGVSNLEGAVIETLEARLHLKLPTRFVVLENNGFDTHAILLDTAPDIDTGENHVHYVAWECVDSEVGSDPITFQSYLEYARHVLAIKSELMSEDDIEFGPSEYQLDYPSL